MLTPAPARAGIDELIALTDVLVPGLAAGRALEASLDIASAAAAIAVTRPGAVASMPTRAEIDAALAGR